MKITESQYERIAHVLPKQRGNVRITNLLLINAILYVLENGCKWRALPKEFGNWHTVYTRLYRWAKKGVLRALFAEMQRQQLITIKVEVNSLDSFSAKAHPDASGALKNGRQAIGKTRGGWNTKIHTVAGNDKLAVDFTLSPGNHHDAPEGRILLETIGKQPEVIPLLMDRTYEDDYTRYIAQMLKFGPIVPPKSNRKAPWDYDKELHKQCNEVERLFRRLASFRRVFTRYDKLDFMYEAFVCFALVVISLR